MDKILSNAAVIEFEYVIRDMAGEVVSSAVTRRKHPSYGMTKRLINEQAQRMAGAIGTYMVLMGQSRTTHAWRSATFTQPRTTEVVEQALTTIAQL